jgi:hypothetical protein
LNEICGCRITDRETHTVFIIVGAAVCYQWRVSGSLGYILIITHRKMWLSKVVKDALDLGFYRARPTGGFVRQ